MGIRKIEYLGSEVLREKAVEVTDFDADLEALVDDMFKTMYDAQGAGLAAPQIGISRRILVFDVRDEEGDEAAMALVNPRIVEKSKEMEKGVEGCLSIPGVDEYVERHAEVVVEAFLPDGTEVELEGSGMVARVLQHEIDHLDGILFIDRISPLKRSLLLKKYRKLEKEREEEEARS